MMNPSMTLFFYLLELQKSNLWIANKLVCDVAKMLSARMRLMTDEIQTTVKH